jgi:hypothetical protein
MPKNKRHPILLDDIIWTKLCAESGREQSKRKKPVSPAQLAREILKIHLKNKQHY